MKFNPTIRSLRLCGHFQWRVEQNKIEKNAKPNQFTIVQLTKKNDVLFHRLHFNNKIIKKIFHIIPN